MQPVVLMLLTHALFAPISSGELNAYRISPGWKEGPSSLNELDGQMNSSRQNPISQTGQNLSSSRIWTHSNFQPDDQIALDITDQNYQGNPKKLLRHLQRRFAPFGLQNGGGLNDDVGSSHSHVHTSTLKRMQIIHLMDEINNNHRFSPTEYLYGMCPGKYTCSKAGRSNETTDMFKEEKCCIECDCSDDCYMTGNCCLDKAADDFTSWSLPHDDDNVALEECRTMVQPDTEELAVKMIQHGYTPYLIISSCRNNETSTEKEKCEHPDKDSLDEVTPMYSNVSASYYRNVFCARCNGETTDLVQWKAHLSCPSQLTNRAILRIWPKGKELMDFHQTDCYLYWTPPVLAHKVCQWSNHLHMNLCKNRKDDRASQLLMRWCREFTALYRNNGKMYNNFFCYLCEVQDIISSSASFDEHGCRDKCAILDARNCRNETYVVEINPYEAVDRLSESNREAGKQACGSGHLFSPLLNECVEIGCGVGMAYKNGDCVPVFGNVTDGVCLNYHLKLYFKLHVAVDDEYARFHAALSVFDRSKRNFEMIRHDAEYSHTTKNGSKVYVSSITIQLKSPANLFQLYNAFISSSELYDDGVTEAINISSLSSLTTMNLGAAGFARYTNNPYGCKMCIAMSPLHFCKSIVLKPSQFTIDSNYMLHIMDRQFQPSQYIIRPHFLKNDSGPVDEFAQICEETFLSKTAVIGVSNAALGIVTFENTLIAFALACFGSAISF